MKRHLFAVLISTIYLLIFTFLTQMGNDSLVSLIFLMFVFSPVVVVWMVMRILKDERPAQRTFDEYWYCDSDLKRTAE